MGVYIYYTQFKVGHVIYCRENWHPSARNNFLRLVTHAVEEQRFDLDGLDPTDDFFVKICKQSAKSNTKLSDLKSDAKKLGQLALEPRPSNITNKKAMHRPEDFQAKLKASK